MQVVLAMYYIKQKLSWVRQATEFAKMASDSTILQLFFNFLLEILNYSTLTISQLPQFYYLACSGMERAAC